MSDGDHIVPNADTGDGEEARRRTNVVPGAKHFLYPTA